MCKICDLKPVYEFTNKRKLCKRCFIHWFNKKVLYTNRRFSMLRRDEVVAYENKGDFRGVVLEEILKLFSDKICFSLIKLPTKKKFNKIAVAETTDSESNKIIRALIEKDLTKIKADAVEGKKIKLLYLFLDKEVELYAKLKKLKYSGISPKKDKISIFVEEMEKLHPEIKQAIIGSYLELEK
jgi:hypothetical protein